MKDPIERQDAIDALEREKTYCSAFREGYSKTDIFEKYNMGLTDGIKAIKNIPSAQQWIPCSDENPKADGRYLITGKMGTVYSLDFEDGRWYGGIKPVAWMPLPKPYAERREE